MSYSDPAANFAPPPPPPARRSPWLWVGLGCGTIVALFFIMIAVFAVSMKKAMDKPFDSKAAVAAMGDVPVIPGAVLDPQMSKVQQITASVMKSALAADSANVTAYLTPGPSDNIMTWYDDAMEKRGYTVAAATDARVAQFSQGTEQHQYTKGKDRVIVQAQKRPKMAHQYVLLLMRFVNARNN